MKINFIGLKEKLLNSKLSKITVKNYLSQLQKIKNIDISQVYLVKFASKKYKPLSFKNTVNAIIKYIKLTDENNIKLIDQYLELSDYLSELDIINPNIKTDKEQLKWTKFENLLKVLNNYYLEIIKYNILNRKYDELNKSNKTILLNYIILSLYLLQPPRRVQDYSKCLIVNYDVPRNNKYNYLIIKNDQVLHFEFNQYKSKAKFGKQIINIKDKLKIVLNNYIKIVYENKPIYLLLYNNKPITANNLSKKITNIFINSYLNKSISVNIIRHIYITNVLGTDELDKMENKKKMAYEMGHGLNTQQKYIKL
tara:strand:+ start:282 stop:1211 length:930 start_codon:yes stop_codon:yes gene_type:complete